MISQEEFRASKEIVNNMCVISISQSTTTVTSKLPIKKVFYGSEQWEEDFIGPRQNPTKAILLKKQLGLWLEHALLPVLKQIADSK